MKRTISLLIAGTAVLTSFTGAFAESVSMTVDEAIDYAMENSLETVKTKAEITSNQYAYYQTKLIQRSLKKNPYLEVTSVETVLSLKGYYTEAADLALKASERSLEDLSKTTEADIKNAFYTYLNSAEAEEIARENLAITQDRMDAAKQKLDSGTISQLDYSNFELSYISAENALNQATRNKEYNLTKLKSTMNFPEEDGLVPVGEFVYDNTDPEAPEAAIEKSRQGNIYLNLSESLELAELKWKCVSGYYTSNHNSYRSEKAAYEAAQYDFKINVNNLDLKIKNLYNNLITLKEQISYMEEYVQYLKESTDAMYLRYEMGLVTANDYREMQQNHFTSRNSLQELKLSYVITGLSYEGLYN